MGEILDKERSQRPQSRGEFLSSKTVTPRSSKFLTTRSSWRYFFSDNCSQIFLCFIVEYLQILLVVEYLQILLVVENFELLGEPVIYI